MTDYYPRWLGPAVVAGQAPWPQALRFTWGQFLTSYTLHDSLWLGLYLESGQEGLLAIRWDTYWTNGRVPFPGSTVATWPILLCRLTQLAQVQIALAEDGIADAESSPTVPAEENADPLCRTVISAHDGTIASFVHSSTVTFLCLSAEGKHLSHSHMSHGLTPLCQRA